MERMHELIEAWDEAHWEFTLAFEGLSDEDLWRRAHPALLSIGELAGHVAYWQAVWTQGGGEDHPDPVSLPIKSPLIDHAYRYYSTSVDSPASAALSVAEVLGELKRIHVAAKEALVGRSFADPFPGQWGTWGKLVRYQVFHVAYHCGQAYSVRHLMGHETTDN